MKPEFYAFRHYKDGKRQELWQLTKGRYPTGKGITITTKELKEHWELNFNVKRINKNESKHS